MKRFLSVLMSVSIVLSVFGMSFNASAETKLKKPSGAYAYATSETSVTLDWDNVRSAKKYIVYGSTKKKKGYKKLATVKKSTYKFVKGKAGKTYYFRVKAVKEKSASPYSDIFTAKTYRLYDKAKMRAAYIVKVNEIIKKYGKGQALIDHRYDGYGDSPLYYIYGLALVKLIDYNNDGVPELTLMYKANKGTNYRSASDNYKVLVYEYRNGTAVKVLENYGSLNGSAPVGVLLNAVKGKNKKIKIVRFLDTDGYVPTKVFSFNSGAFKENFYNTKKGNYYVNGKKVSMKRWLDKSLKDTDGKDYYYFVASIDLAEAQTLLKANEKMVKKLSKK